MTHRTNLIVALALGVASVAFSTGGCELIASVDRTKIGAGGSGGAGVGGGGSTPASSSTTASSMATGGGGTGGATGGGGTGGGTGGGCQGDGDCPAPSNDCEVATCDVPTGTCSNENAPADTPCASSGGSVCDGNGACVECNAPTDCPPPTSECEDATCTGGTCGTSDKPQGTACGLNGALSCDDMGQCTGCDDVGQCTPATAECQAADCDLGTGICSFINDPIDTTCAENGGTVCDDTGTCVDCNMASQCPPSATLCVVVASCTSNQCVNSNEPTHTPCSDSGGTVCDGNGVCVACVDATDCPAGNQCQDPTCTGAPACDFTNKPDTTPCTENGGDQCMGGVCVPTTGSTCSDGIQNQGETDIDCGGPNCPASCGTGQTCSGDGDCVSGNCPAGTCQPAGPTCSDGIKNQDESDIDCGGVCGNTCVPGEACVTNVDCNSNVCVSAFCYIASCGNTVQDGNETGVDCGGADCAGCAGDPCVTGFDCVSGFCTGSMCN